MTRNSSKKSALVMLSVLSAIISTTFLISIIARGYILKFDNGLKITATGLLSANSIPKNANVIINEKLYTTTDDTINLIPGDYQLQIIKEGYLPWTKKITIQKEMVAEVKASLFKSKPILMPITTQGVINPTTNSDLTQIAFIVSSSSASATIKPGIYIIETNYLSSVLNKYQPKFIVQNPYNPNDTTLSFIFSPNSKQLIIKSTLKHSQYLIDLATSQISQPNEKTNLDWTLQSKQLSNLNLSKLPKVFTSTISTSPQSITFSGDEKKFMYLLEDKYFVYDIEKDLNHLIGNQNEISIPFWLPQSNNIIYTNSNQIKTVEFDSTNHNTIYSSQNSPKILIPEFDGEKIVISTATESGTPENIYTLTIR